MPQGSILVPFVALCKFAKWNFVSVYHITIWYQYVILKPARQYVTLVFYWMLHITFLWMFVYYIPTFVLIYHKKAEETFLIQWDFFKPLLSFKVLFLIVPYIFVNFPQVTVFFLCRNSYKRSERFKKKHNSDMKLCGILVLKSHQISKHCVPFFEALRLISPRIPCSKPSCSQPL